VSDSEDTPSNIDEILDDLHNQWGPGESEDYNEFLKERLLQEIHHILYTSFRQSYVAPAGIVEAIQASIEAFLAYLDGNLVDDVNDAFDRAVFEIASGGHMGGTSL
jgi:hypothetical protein